MGLLHTVLHRVFTRSLFRQRYFFVLDDMSEVIRVAPREPISFSVVTDENVAVAGSFRERIFIEAFRTFLREGEAGVYAFAGSECVGHGWATICREPRFMANGYFELRKGQALIHHCEVERSHRGRNIYPAMLVELCQRLFTSQGINRVFIETAPENVPSVRGLRKVGFRPHQRLFYVRYKGRFVVKKYCAFTEAMLAKRPELAADGTAPESGGRKE